MHVYRLVGSPPRTEYLNVTLGAYSQSLPTLRSYGTPPGGCNELGHNGSNGHDCCSNSGFTFVV